MVDKIKAYEHLNLGELKVGDDDVVETDEFIIDRFQEMLNFPGRCWNSFSQKVSEDQMLEGDSYFALEHFKAKDYL